MYDWRAYLAGSEAAAGYGSPAQVQEIMKAMAAGADRDPPGSFAAGDGFAFRTESLERVQRNATFRAEHLKFWRLMPKKPAFNTVEEYNRVESYGPSGVQLFITEGALPPESDPTVSRQFLYLKYMGVTQRVTHQMTLVRPAHGNVLANITVAGAMRLLEGMERSLIGADSELDPVQFDGIAAQIERGAGSTNVIDMRGAPLNEDAVCDASLIASDEPNYGQITDLIGSPKAKNDFLKALFPRGRHDQFQKTDKGFVGLDIRGVATPSGDVVFHSNVFMNEGGLASAVTAYGDVSLRPATPVVTTPLASPATTGSLFTGSDAGTYRYQIVAANASGNSAPVSVGSVAVISGDAVTFGITPGAGPQPTHWWLYRSAKDGAAASERLIVKIVNDDAMGETTITDLNEDLPGTTKAIGVQNNEDNWAFKMLAPMMKIPLATIDGTIRWQQVIYGAPVLYTPKHNVLFKNIGRAPGSAGT